MRKRVTKALALTLAAAVSTTMFSACGTENKTKKVEQTDTNKEKFKISYASYTTGPLETDNAAKKALAKAMPDVEINLLAFERASWKDQINTRVAAGDIPDIIFRDSRDMVEQYVLQNVLAELPLDMVKKNAPNWFKGVEQFGAEAWMSSNINGKNYGLPSMTMRNARPGSNGWRMDWLKNVGITKVPETLDEMEAAFKKFVNEDPDKNGKKDTFAICPAGMPTVISTFSVVFGAFGVYPNFWSIQKDNTLKSALTTSQAKSTLTLLQKWYKEGLIDPEFITSDASKVKQKFANGKVGYIIDSTWDRLIPGGEHYEALKAVNPNAELVMGPAVKGPEGKYGYYNWGKIAGCFTFSKQLEGNQAKFAKALELMDKLSSDKELYMLTHFGVEGENWKRNAATNAVEYIPPYNDPNKRGALGTNLMLGLATPEIQTYIDRKDAADLYKYAIDGNVLDGKDYVTWVGSLIPAEVKQKADPATQMETKWMIEFVIGTKSMDHFDTFVKDWEAAGGAALTKAANEAYKTGRSQIDAIKASIK